LASTRTTTPDPAAADASTAEATPQLLTFAVAGRRYGCRLEAVREIFVARPTTRLPGAPPHVLGLLNVRGSVLTVLDVAQWLAEEDASASQMPGTAERGMTRKEAEGAESDATTTGFGGFRHHSASSAFLPGGGESVTPTGHILVVECEGRLGGCRVEGLGRAMAMPALDPAPGGNDGVGEIVLGVGEVDGELVAVLDLPRLVRHSLLFPGER
jgi:chemotaxis signal transduction protein